MSYIHGFTPEEQKRLADQGRYLEERVHSEISLAKGSHLLEVGCGVGAQTEVLLRRNPGVRITAVDASEAQLATARKRVSSPLVEFVQSDATKMPWKEAQFDAAFICWVLEHVSDPVAILREAARVLKPGAVIYLREVLNTTLWTWPTQPGLLDYWRRFNEFQASHGGDGEVGGKLGSYLHSVGFREVALTPIIWMEDGRNTETRNTFYDYLRELLLSALPQLSNSSFGKPNDLDTIQTSFDELKANPDSAIYFGYISARAKR